MTAETLRQECHGTRNGYSLGCRCDQCRRARAEAAGFRWAGECIKPVGEGKAATSECAQIASQLVDAQTNLARVARLANRSAKNFAKYGEELRAAKDQRARVLRRRDEHMTECPAASDRFAS